MDKEVSPTIDALQKYRDAHNRLTVAREEVADAEKAYEDAQYRLASLLAGELPEIVKIAREIPREAAA